MHSIAIVARSSSAATRILWSARSSSRNANGAESSVQFKLDLPQKLKPLILASASERRRDLLRTMGLSFRVQAPQIVEELVGTDLRQALIDLALRKAESVAASIDRGTILGADTVVEIEGRILGKPRDEADAREMLERLSGALHRVHSAVALLHRPSDRVVTGFESTQVWFREISRREVDDYLGSGEPLGKAGAYAIQGLAGDFVRRITGSKDNVIGLPRRTLAQLFKELERRL